VSRDTNTGYVSPWLSSSAVMASSAPVDTSYSAFGFWSRRGQLPFHKGRCPCGGRGGPANPQGESPQDIPRKQTRYSRGDRGRCPGVHYSYRYCYELTFPPQLQRWRERFTWTQGCFCKDSASPCISRAFSALPVSRSRSA
jgi:hypothetical protein